jgi:hypothetical protein
MLENWLPPQMIEDSEDFIIQQDGASPHWDQDIRNFLNECLPQQWIGRIGNGLQGLVISHPATLSVTKYITPLLHGCALGSI